MALGTKKLLGKIGGKQAIHMQKIKPVKTGFPGPGIKLLGSAFWVANITDMGSGLEKGYGVVGASAIHKDHFVFQALKACQLRAEDPYILGFVPNRNYD